MSFNEAGAFPPRKLGEIEDARKDAQEASMRPGRFHPGNHSAKRCHRQSQASFNEAGAFPPRKFTGDASYCAAQVKLQ